ncbi:hypothetical protein RI054_20g90260 [Pseudoscourfieldia marina]
MAGFGLASEMTNNTAANTSAPASASAPPRGGLGGGGGLAQQQHNNTTLGGGLGGASSSSSGLAGYGLARDMAGYGLAAAAGTPSDSAAAQAPSLNASTGNLAQQQSFGLASEVVANQNQGAPGSGMQPVPSQPGAIPAPQLPHGMSLPPQQQQQQQQQPADQRIPYVFDETTNQLRASSFLATATSQGTTAQPTFWQRMRPGSLFASLSAGGVAPTSQSSTDFGGGVLASSTLQAVSESVEGIVYAGGLFAQGCLAGLCLLNAIILYMSNISTTEALAVYYGPISNHVARLGYALAVVSLLACVDSHAKETEALEAAVRANSPAAAIAAVGARSRKRLWLVAAFLYLACVALGLYSLPFEDVLHYTHSREPRWYTMKPIPSTFVSAMDAWHTTNLLRTLLGLVGWAVSCSAVRTVLSDQRRRVIYAIREQMLDDQFGTATNATNAAAAATTNSGGAQQRNTK